jgi:elongation factor P
VISTSDLRKGIVIEIDGEIWQVLEYNHIKMGRGSAQVRIKLRNVRRGQTIERTFQAGEKWPRAFLEQRQVQFLYSDGNEYHFMDTESYEQVQLSADVLGDAVGFLKPEMSIHIEFYGEQPVGIELPQTVDLKVTQTVPGIKGATASNQIKPATTETGLVVSVPPFVNEGDIIRVSTETGEYLARA